MATFAIHLLAQSGTNPHDAKYILRSFLAIRITVFSSRCKVLPWRKFMRAACRFMDADAARA